LVCWDGVGGFVGGDFIGWGKNLKFAGGIGFGSLGSSRR